MPRREVPGFDAIVETAKLAGAALREADVPVLLGGGLAIWARGGPPTDHDVDFVLRERHAERAMQVLAEAGMQPERPPEDWLLKAWRGDILVDLIFRPAGGAVDDAYFARGTLLDVAAQPMLVASVDDVLISKVMALSEQAPNFQGVLEIARSLREQIDWDVVRGRVSSSPFGAAFLTLVEELDIAPRRSASVQRLHRAATTRV